MPTTTDELRSLQLTPIHARDTEPTWWWWSSVIHQVCPRSFRDLDGDGDLAGITAELGQLTELDIEAISLSPFYPPSSTAATT